jgi:hypothetical protein
MQPYRLAPQGVVGAAELTAHRVDVPLFYFIGLFESHGCLAIAALLPRSCCPTARVEVSVVMLLASSWVPTFHLQHALHALPSLRHRYSLLVG